MWLSCARCARKGHVLCGGARGLRSGSCRQSHGIAGFLSIWCCWECRCWALWLQTHIFFFSVSGNETVPAERILWVLEEYGIKFGVPADAVDLNAVKNQVLAQLPELGWITINTEGASAEVVVRERAEKPAISRASGPANVTAKKSGLITEVEVTGGSPAGSEGQYRGKGRPADLRHHQFGQDPAADQGGGRSIMPEPGTESRPFLRKMRWKRSIPAGKQWDIV